MDLQRKQFKTEFNGKPLTLEVSQLAGQANAAVMGTYGDTTVLVTAVMSKKDKPGDYFPLMVNYEEKHYAVGKILGSRFMKRESRPSDEAVLTGRLIDRTIRPLFDQRTRREVQVVITVLSYDGENDPDFIGLLTSSVALATSSIPWNGPVAGVRITNGDQLNTFVAGTADKINMVEFEGNEVAESEAVQAFTQAQVQIKELVSWQKKIISEIGKPKSEIKLNEPKAELLAAAKDFLKGRLEKAVYNPSKAAMYENLDSLKEELKTALTEKEFSEGDISAVDAILEEEVNQLVHEKILKEEKRPDGRKLNQLRELHAEAGILKRLHGSALFVRGNTQSLAVTTLGAPGDQQLLETMEFSGKKRFMLHYNFPPFSTGEVGRMGAPGRREIGHGALAEKALRPLIPTQEEFPYTIRVVSEILSSNGSSSMASVCAGSLSLMDAGVPIRRPAAGIAMGLILDESGKQFKVLTDIQGPEDHHGDMDFKAAGTENGVTAIQMDVKVNGVTVEILEKTLIQAKEARLQILKTITGALPAPRAELSPFAPRIITWKINPEKIGELIGPGGKNINGIIDETGVTAIDIEDDGLVLITSVDAAAAEKALARVKASTKEFQIGDIVEGNIVKILEFGAIVEFDGRDGMIHVSELKEGFVKKVEDVVKLGDFVRAKIVKMDNGKIGLSIKQLNK
ncbi:MAG: polyribonucleotide nucleotidyltransferase [bacterium]|nr:polyribonucleotide nucleotidyltransferase [bacterium]